MCWVDRIRETAIFIGMELTIITVNYNGGKMILEQMASLGAGAEDLEYEQIVSDNGSTDDSLAGIRKFFPEVKIVENGKNLGFSAANNLALPHAKGELLLFLNPDMRVLPGSLKAAVLWMREHSDVGILGPKLTDAAGNFNKSAGPRRFPGLSDQLALVLKIPHFFPGVLKHYLYHGFNPDLEQEVETVRGSFMLMRRSLTEKLGFAFDPRYFIWFEDIDVCREAKRLGYKVMYSPVISCVDYVSQIFKTMSCGLKQRWFTESMIKYFKKWEPWYKWPLLALARPLGIFLADAAGAIK